MELVDPKLKSEFKEEEAERMIKVSLLCTSGSPSLRPTMSEVVGMLKEQLTYQRSYRNQAVDPTLAGSSTSGQDLFEVNAESYLRLFDGE
ncbi:hypothetical protein QYF36_023751 [Acer negundo]|nr:hypothetical protein QYF36_023751 [Acer negundo]